MRSVVLVVLFSREQLGKWITFATSGNTGKHIRIVWESKECCEDIKGKVVVGVLWICWGFRIHSILDIDSVIIKREKKKKFLFYSQSIKVWMAKQHTRNTHEKTNNEPRMKRNFDIRYSSAHCTRWPRQYFQGGNSRLSKICEHDGLRDLSNFKTFFSRNKLLKFIQKM